jgi:glycine reductase complex component B subunit gamma
VFITALPTIATMVGVNRTLRGMAVTSPVGDPARDTADELALRTRMVQRALTMLETPVERPTVWEVA